MQPFSPKELPQMALFEEGKCRALCFKEVWLISRISWVLIAQRRKIRNQHLIKSPIPTPNTYNSPFDEDYKGPQDFVKLFDCTHEHCLN